MIISAASVALRYRDVLATIEFTSSEKNPNSIVRFDSAHAPIYYWQFQQFLKRLELTPSTCSIYGAATSGTLTYELVRQAGFTVNTFIDRQKSGFLLDTPIQHPKNADWGDLIFISISPQYCLSALQSLKRFLKSQIPIIFLWEIPFLSSDELSSLDLESIDYNYPNWLGMEVLRATAGHEDIWEYLARGTIQAGANRQERDRAIVERLVYPHVTATSTVLEIGPGCGLTTRPIIAKVTTGALHLFEYEQWWQVYLESTVLPERPNTYVHECNGYNLSGIDDKSIDLVFCGSVFTGLPPSRMFSYLVDIARVLRPGGRFVCNFCAVSDYDHWLARVEEDLAVGAHGAAYYPTDLVVQFLRGKGLEREAGPLEHNYFVFCKSDS